MADEKLGEGLPPADESFVQLPGDGAGKAVMMPPPAPAIPGTGKPFGAPKILEYVTLAVDKKFGEKLTDEECEMLGLPPGSTMPDPDSFIPNRPKFPGPPAFTLDEAVGEEEEHAGHEPTFHTQEEPGTSEGLAAAAKALFDSLLQQGFGRDDALELVKEMIRMSYFPDHAAKK